MKIEIYLTKEIPDVAAGQAIADSIKEKIQEFPDVLMSAVVSDITQLTLETPPA